MSKFTARELKAWSSVISTNIGWIPARPINYTLDGWRVRIKLAWGVLTGKYDALDWECDQ